MWRILFDAPFPDEKNMLPPAVRGQAERRIRGYWMSRGWQLVLGEVVLWAATVYLQQSPGSPIYLFLAGLIGIAYLLAFQPNTMLWLLGMLVLFGLQGLYVQGLGAVTALTYMVPYSIAGMIMGGRKRILVQSACVFAFWMSLLYELLPVLPQIEPTRYVIVSYNILIAAFTFQTLRFLNQLAVDINSEYVAAEVRMQSQQFLARVSHELRTPLNSMLGFSKLLRRAELTERQQSHLYHAIAEGEHLNQLVSDLLDSAHLSTGKLTLKMAPTDVNVLCRAVADEHRHALLDGVALVTDFGGDLPTISADPLRLRQAVGNLVGNAVKHTQAGAITVRTRCQDDTITIDVADTGTGISAEQQKLIFVPFVQLDERRAGVGLGLDIALQLVRLHGGDITLESTVGKGSTFTITLPTD